MAAKRLSQVAKLKAENEVLRAKDAEREKQFAALEQRLEARDQTIGEMERIRHAPQIRVPAVRVTVRRTAEEAQRDPVGGEYFDTCYEVRARTADDFRRQMETIAAVIGSGHDPTVTTVVAFVGIRRL